MLNVYFELNIRLTLAPIPLAFSAQNGFTQEVIRYLRGCLACAVHPVLIMLGAAYLPTIITVITTIVGGDPATMTGPTAAMAIALAFFILNTYINSTKSLAKEIIGH